jgi:hypothetical protein
MFGWDDAATLGIGVAGGIPSPVEFGPPPGAGNNG